MTVIPHQSLRNIKQGMTHRQSIQLVTASAEVITIDSGTVVITKPSTAAALVVLGTPDARADGCRLRITSSTAEAHTLAITGGVGGVGTGADVGTFGGAIGDGIEFVASGGVWFTVENTNVTLA